MSEINNQVEESMMKGIAKDGVLLEDTNNIATTVYIPTEAEQNQEIALKAKLDAIVAQAQAEYQAELEKIQAEKEKQEAQAQAEWARREAEEQLLIEEQRKYEEELANRPNLPPTMKFTDLINPYHNELTIQDVEKICGSIPYSSRLTPEMVEEAIRKEEQERVLAQIEDMVNEQAALDEAITKDKSAWQKIKDAVVNFFTLPKTE